MLVKARSLFGGTILHGFVENRLNWIRDLSCGIHLIDVNVTVTVEAATGGDHAGIMRHSDTEHAARKRRQFPQQIGIIADLSRGNPRHAVDARHAVGAAEEDFIAEWMGDDALDAAFQGARGNRRDVVDESLCGDFNQLGRHVAADRNQVVTIDGEGSAEDPIVVGLLEQDLRASFRVDGADGFVGAAEGDSLAVWRPGCAKQGIIRDRNRQHEFLVGDVPDLYFTRATGASASDGELLAIRREADRLDSFGHADQSGNETGAVGFVEQHFVIAGHCEQLAARRPVDRCDHGRAAVDGRVLGIDWRRCVRRRVIFGAFFNPLPNQRDVTFREGRLFLWHRSHAFCVGRDLFEQIAVVRLSGDDRRRVAFATDEHVFENSEIELAAGFGWLVAALAIGLQDWEDGSVVADPLRLLGWRARFWRSGWFVVGDDADRQQQTNRSDGGDAPSRDRTGPVKKCHPTGSSRWECRSHRAGQGGRVCRDHPQRFVAAKS